MFGAAGLLAVVLFHLDAEVGILISLGLGLLAGLIALGILRIIPLETASALHIISAFNQFQYPLADYPSRDDCEGIPELVPS